MQIGCSTALARHRTRVRNYLCYDTFTRANSTTLGSSQTTGPENQTVPAETWTETSGDSQIISNQVGAVAAAETCLATVDVSKADVVIEATIIQNDITTYPGLVGRVTSNTSHWQLLPISSTDLLALYEVNPGFTLRASAAYTNVSGQTMKLRLQMQGDEIIGSADGGSQIKYESTFNNTVTRHGVKVRQGTSQDGFADDFRCYNYGG